MSTHYTGYIIVPKEPLDVHVNGPLLQKLRLERQLALLDARNVIGVDQGGLWRLENDQEANPSMITMFRIAEFYNVPLMDLFIVPKKNKTKLKHLTIFLNRSKAEKQLGKNEKIVLVYVRAARLDESRIKTKNVYRKK